MEVRMNTILYIYRSETKIIQNTYCALIFVFHIAYIVKISISQSLNLSLSLRNRDRAETTGWQKRSEKSNHFV